MRTRNYSTIVVAIVAAAVTAALASQTLMAQRESGSPGPGGGPQGRAGDTPDGRGGRGAAPQLDLPSQPTAVALPTMTKSAGPGAMFDSSPAQWPGRDMKHFNYVANEYLVSGTANGQPYTTRVVVRQPADNARFSGLVVAESMHPIGAAHAFEYNSVYIMNSGHIAVEIATNGAAQFAPFNAERYGQISVLAGQNNEILAQVGALVKSAQGPLAGLTLRKMILWGTSASSGTLVQYLPAHMVYRTPDMQRIYDGFMPTSNNGNNVTPVDVPMILVPTQHEFENIATTRQDSDEPGQQFRVYEFPGMGHLDARNNSARFTQKDCPNTLTTFPNEAYFSVALHHLLRWVDTGTPAPKADRVYMDINREGDGSLMALDEHGNAKGGIRTPYTDVPVTKYIARNITAEQAAAAARGRSAGGGRAGGAAQGSGGQGAAAPPAGAPPGGGRAAGPGGGRGAFPAAQLCNLSVWEQPIAPAKRRQMYGNKDSYVRRFEQRLNELEKAGWSLPVYHDLLLADVRAVTF